MSEYGDFYVVAKNREAKMGKSRNKNKDKEPFQKKEREDDEGSDSDESTSTHLTFDDDMTSVRGEIEDDVDDVIDKLAEHIENAQHKNTTIRRAAQFGIQMALTSEYVPAIVEKYKCTLMDLLTKCIRNRPDDEIRLCARILALVSIQIGGDISDYVEDALSALRIIVADPTRGLDLREVCAYSLALTSRLSSESDEGIAASVKACKTAWTSVKNNTKAAEFYHAALASWCLLLADATGETLTSAVADQPKIVTYLQADLLDVRIASGEALAYLFEFFSECRPGFRFPNHDHVVNLIDGLTNEFTKSKGKKDKRIQRFTFRDISSFMSGRSDAPCVNIKFGNQTLALDNCSIKLFYDVCCQILHGGMMRHLQSNEYIRDLFDLGPVEVDSVRRTDKVAKKAMHDAADKYRNQIRNNQRDKRNAFF